MKCEFGLYGVVGGMTMDGMSMIELLAYTTRRFTYPRGRMPCREIRLSRSNLIAGRAM